MTTRPPHRPTHGRGEPARVPRALERDVGPDRGDRVGVPGVEGAGGADGTGAATCRQSPRRSGYPAKNDQSGSSRANTAASKNPKRPVLRAARGTPVAAPAAAGERRRVSTVAFADIVGPMDLCARVVEVPHGVGRCAA
jgi:hypothetical protein